jgi:hypothetical protein
MLMVMPWVVPAVPVLPVLTQLIASSPKLKFSA